MRVLERALNFAPRTELEEAEAPEKPNAAKPKIVAHFILAPVMMEVLEMEMQEGIVGPINERTLNDLEAHYNRKGSTERNNKKTTA